MSELNDPIDVPRPQLLSEEHIREQMQVGMAAAEARVPIHERPPLTPPITDGPPVVQCKDGMPRFRVLGFGNDPKATTRCETVDHDGNAQGVFQGRGGTCIARATTSQMVIPVQRIDLESGKIERDSHQFKLAEADPRSVGVPAVFERPVGDGSIGVATPDFETHVDPVIGVPYTERTTTLVGRGVETPVTPTRDERFRSVIAAAATAIPVPPKSAPAEVPVAHSPRKIRVTLSSKGIGTVRLKVDYFGKSASCVILGYNDSDDALIYEPPIGSKDDPVTVEIEGERLLCVYYGFSSYMPIGDQRVLLVVLVRADQ